MIDPTTLELFNGFLASLAASAVDRGLNRLLSKNIDSKLQSCFEKAHKKLNAQHDIDPEGCPIDDYWDLAKYIGVSDCDNPKEISAQIDLWILECLKYPDCMDFIINYKQDVVIENQSINTHLLNGINENQNIIKQTIDAIDRKTNALISREEEYATMRSFQYEQDLATLTELMKAFSFDMLDEFCQKDPSTIRRRLFDCCQVWEAIICRTAYHIYDSELDRLIKDFYTVWSEAMDIGSRFYFPIDASPYSRFGSNAYPFGSSKEQYEVYDRLIQLRIEMIPKLKALADHIHHHYEIDLEACALTAFASNLISD